MMLWLLNTKTLLNIPPFCDQCGSPFSLDHFLICKEGGGLITQHHNEIQNAIGDLTDLVWDSVKCELVVRDISHDDSGEALITDLCVQGAGSPRLRCCLKSNPIYANPPLPFC